MCWVEVVSCDCFGDDIIVSDCFGVVVNFGFFFVCEYVFFCCENG